ncbi:type II toxin-antitoxin system HigB family toxin [Mesorhizobium marinum]|uniref:Type II toxin-antitoxin system HigB family toxin n=1 Tax=Mesorhizobium marinum TaxID=3228790 RepID=A0ABV3R3A4_9HYPH
MRVIAQNTLVEYWTKHPAAKRSLVHWHQVTKSARWDQPQDVLVAFSKAKVLNAERVRFEIGGGDYRLVVAFDFRRQIAFVKFLGTHAEYDRIDALKVSIF